MEEQKQYGFGIVGAGVIAEFHAKAIAEIGNAVLKGIYTRTASKAEAFASQFSCVAYPTLEAMLEQADIDIVCICTPSGIHLEPALACIAAGKHCLVEKPLEVTVERCDQIIQAAGTAGVKAGVIFPSRFYAASMRLKEALDQNKFGDLVLGDAYVKWHRSMEYYQSGAWRGTWQFDGGGALMNQGIHSVDLLQWYMGPVISVQAVSANALHKTIEVEDTIVALVQFANGALGTIECSTAVFPGSLKRIEVRGTRGSAVLEEDQLIEWAFQQADQEDDLVRRVQQEGHPSSGGASDPKAIRFTGHQRQIEDLIRAIDTDGTPAVTVAEGRKSVAIIEAIYESARTGKKITLKEN
jgi:predicted dehydrogenase